MSGLFSGPNPSPGLGTARSLRQAFPTAAIIGVDYSNRSTGLHWPDFDEIWLQRPWDELDLDCYRDQVKGVLDEGCLWISGLDLETIWLARSFGSHPNLLTPPRSSLDRIRKPATAIAEALGLASPRTIGLQASDWDLSAFCRSHDWQVWLKGPYYEARSVQSWGDFLEARRDLSETWSVIDELFLQEHVTGHEESVALSAHRGTLVAVAYMVKRELTQEGKTWAAQVRDVPAELEAAVRDVVAKLRWTGGAEVELIRDSQDRLHLLEWNPRYPAWIHGATIAGRNLPAQLIAAAAMGSLAPTGTTAFGEVGHFVRTVVEIPVREGFPVPPLAERPDDTTKSVGKHPSGMPLLASRLHPRERSAVHSPPPIAASIHAEISRVTTANLRTPQPMFLRETAEADFAAAAQATESASLPNLRVRVAYSMKTNPDRRLLEIAHRRGFLMETISQLEARAAIGRGFAPQDIILNGPAKWWPGGSDVVETGTVFADSLADLEGIVRRAESGSAMRVIGARLKLPGIESRFGIDVERYSELQDLREIVRGLPTTTEFGIHFHIASSAAGIDRWWDLFESSIRWCRLIGELCDRPVRCLDVGGGWFPDDFSRHLAPALPAAVRRVSALLDDVRLIILELGKAIAQNSTILVVRVIRVDRGDDGSGEILVDGSIAELPEAKSFPHRVLFLDRASGAWTPLSGGTGRILGRLCMEDDLLATNVRVPRALTAGDDLVFCDAGAYDRSMAYEFGLG